MRYVIIGAGAIGGSIGGRLSQHGHEVVLVARGAHGEAIRANGLTVRSPDDTITVRPEVATRPEEVTLRSDDVLVLATKTHQAEAALLQWVDRPVYSREGSVRGNDSPFEAPVGTAGGSLPILMCLNGVASERLALRYFDRVFGICVRVPAVHLVPGEVILRIAPLSGIFPVGRYPARAASPADAELLAAIARDWREATFEMHDVGDVMPWKHRKLLMNLSNGLSALLGNRGPSHAGIADRLRDEAAAVLAAAGIPCTDEAEERAVIGEGFTVRPVPGEPEEMSGSSWQSMARGSGTVETDFLNGEIAYIAKEHGLSAPLNACIQRLTRQAAARGARPGDMTLTELEELLDEAEDRAR